MGEHDKEPRYRRAARRKIERLLLIDDMFALSAEALSVPEWGTVEVVNDNKADRASLGEGAFVEVKLWVPRSEIDQ